MSQEPPSQPPQAPVVTRREGSQGAVVVERKTARTKPPRMFQVVLLNEAGSRAPVGELVDIDDVGFACAFLATPYARRLTGQTLYIDGGVNIMA